MVYPLVKTQFEPENHPFFSGFTNLPNPTAGRVYVNLLEGHMFFLVIDLFWGITIHYSTHSTCVEETWIMMEVIRTL